MTNKKRLIEVETVIEKIRKANCADCYNCNAVLCRSCLVDDVISLLDDSISVDAVEVVHGRWEKHGKHDWRCSVCKRGVPYSFTGHNYCHNCGSHNVAWNNPKAAEIDFDYEAEDGR